jgi:P-loop containing dynein motor region D4
MCKQCLAFIYYLNYVGLQQKHTVVLLSESRAKDFLEDINNLIHSGIIPDLFTTEEIEAITSSMRALATGMWKR